MPLAENRNDKLRREDAGEVQKKHSAVAHHRLTQVSLILKQKLRLSQLFRRFSSHVLPLRSVVIVLHVTASTSQGKSSVSALSPRGLIVTIW